MGSSQKRRIIGITGASGHLGQWVTAELLSRGYQVLSISRSPLLKPSIAGLNFGGDIHALSLDLTDEKAVASAESSFANLDGLVHLAGYIPEDTNSNEFSDANLCLQGNITTTVHLLQALKNSTRLKTFVYASSFEVYGVPQTIPITEDHPTHPCSFYGASKLTAEKYISLFCKETGLAYSILRLPAVYGPGDRLKRAVGNFVRAAAQGQEMIIQGDGSDRRELLFAKDAAVAVSQCVDRQHNGVLNLGSGSGYTILEMAQALTKIVPECRMVFAERAKPKLNYVLSIEKAVKALGWSPDTALEDGLKEQLEWLSLPTGASS